MTDIMKIRLSGFPFFDRSGGDTIDTVTNMRILLTTLNPLPEEADALLCALDESLAFAARYSATYRELHEFQFFVERFERARRENPENGRRMHDPNRPNIFAPADGLGNTGISQQAATLITRMAAVRDSVEPQVLTMWRRALHDTATILVRAGKAKMAYET